MSTPDKVPLIAVGRALRAHSTRYGPDATTALLERVAGVTDIRNIPSDPTIRRAIIDTVNEADDRPIDYYPKAGSDWDKYLASCLEKYSRVRFLYREPGYWSGTTLFGKGSGSIWFHLQGPELVNQYVGKYSLGDWCNYSLRISDDPVWSSGKMKIDYDAEADDMMKPKKTEES